ncbi:heat shock protein [Trypanosoma grayi]|uniref:heat shock protein n=1 Tax=Trypanosoma grayi TaxID=71804 RepID=UPI0004F498C0|nr:heat shock protein [Trypanosoma grayi]KEG08466.1 heat shock protein [Trypanosoma grayi]
MQRLPRGLDGLRIHSNYLKHLVKSPGAGSFNALLGPRRLCFTTPLEQLVINGACWNDSNYYHRLGFQNEVRDVERIKEHYRILAKHYHPDNPSAPPNATAAFQNIREAYEHVIANAKEDPAKTSDNTSGFHFADHERRRQQMRFLGDGVGLFMVMTLVFIYVVSRHNKERMRARYFWNFLIIFFTIQIFPRLLAAAILYACHTNYLVGLAEAREQAATMVVVERGANELIIRVDGITEEVKENVVLQVTATLLQNKTSGAPVESTNKGSSGASMSTTLTFDAGVMTVSVPAPQEGNTEYSVRAVDEKRGFVLASHTLQM